MASNPKEIFHFTKAASALKILEELKFNPSKVTKCSDPFEIDHSPFYIDLSKESHFTWFCKQILHFYEGGHSFFENLAGAKILSSIPVSNRLTFIKKSLAKGLPKDRLYTSEKFNQDLLQQRERLYVYCFSSCDPASAVGAWANHGDRHAGVALGFNFDPAEYGKRLHQVRYDSRNKRGALFSAKEGIGLYTRMGDPEFRYELFEKILLTKHTDLQWERELRYISFLQDGGASPYLILGEDSITSIYLGLQITDDNKSQIIKLAKVRYPDCKIFSASKDKRLIKINFEEIKE